MAKKVPVKKTKNETIVKMQAALTQVLSDNSDVTANAIMGNMKTDSHQDDEVVHTKAPISIITTQVVEKNTVVPTVTGGTQFQTTGADGRAMPTVMGQRASIGIPTVTTQGVAIPQYPVDTE